MMLTSIKGSGMPIPNEKDLRAVEVLREALRGQGPEAGEKLVAALEMLPNRGPKRRRKGRKGLVNLDELCSLIEVRTGETREPIALPSTKAGNQMTIYAVAHTLLAVARIHLTDIYESLQVAKIYPDPSKLKQLADVIKLASNMAQEAWDMIGATQRGQGMPEDSTLKPLMTTVAKLKDWEHADGTEADAGEIMELVHKAQVSIKTWETQIRRRRAKRNFHGADDDVDTATVAAECEGTPDNDA
jgi:hypothetical protein